MGVLGFRLFAIVDQAEDVHHQGAKTQRQKESGKPSILCFPASRMILF
jgi:hypothetical protein